MIIAVDGPSSAGKGTLARSLAEYFDFAFLDTGLIYRALGQKCLELNIALEEEDRILFQAQSLKAEDLETPNLRTERVADMASKVSALPEVRKALLDFQRRFAYSPPQGKKGAVLDGRDIGTVICPQAPLKIFITADVETRARRRFKELQEKQFDVIYEAVLEDLNKRDARDRNRDHAPLKPAEDAYVLDTSRLSRSEVFEKVIEHILSKGFVKADQPRVFNIRNTTNN